MCMNLLALYSQRYENLISRINLVRRNDTTPENKTKIASVMLICIHVHIYIYMYMTPYSNNIHLIPCSNIRVMGELAVSRSFGDSEFKKGLHVSTIFVFATIVILSSCIFSNNMYITRL
jgi:hypothetical protein